MYVLLWCVVFMHFLLMFGSVYDTQCAAHQSDLMCEQAFLLLMSAAAVCLVATRSSHPHPASH